MRKVWWLADQFQADLELYRFAYAELLFRWEQHTERVLVLNLCRAASDGDARGGKEYAHELLKDATGRGPRSSLGALVMRW